MIGRVLTLIATVTRADRVYAGLTDEAGAVKTGIVRTRAGDKPSAKERVTISQTVAEADGVITTADVKSAAGRRTLGVPVFLIDMLAEHLARAGRTDYRTRSCT